MSEKNRINARLREFLPRLRNGEEDAFREFQIEFLDFVRERAIGTDPLLQLDAVAFDWVTEEAFRLIFKRACDKKQESLTFADLGFAIQTACINQRLAAYLPHLRRGQCQTEFYGEFHDLLMGHARRVVEKRDPNNVANLQDDDLETAVADAFMKIFAIAPVLEQLTWAYVKTMIFFGLTPMLRRGWREAKLRGEMPANPCAPADPDLETLLSKHCAGAKLTEQEEQIVRLKLLYAMRWDQVPDELHVSEATARRLYKSALGKLRRWLADEMGWDWPPEGDAPRESDEPSEDGQADEPKEGEGNQTAGNWGSGETPPQGESGSEESAQGESGSTGDVPA